MQEKRNSGLERYRKGGFRKGGMQEIRDAGKGGIPDWRDTLRRDSELEVHGEEGKQERRETQKEGSEQEAYRTGEMLYIRVKFLGFFGLRPFSYFCVFTIFPLGVLYPEHSQLAFDCVKIACSLESIRQGLVQGCGFSQLDNLFGVRPTPLNMVCTL